jgi:2-amino-4-hydroxy-6-hydroxymethyldihydropteridine diphosphokinase
MGEHQLFLSMGGNLGNKSEIFDFTIRYVEEQIGQKMRISSIYKSASWGFHSRYLFWNQVIEVETRLLPGEILREIRIIEDRFDRKRKPGVYLSRKMDIDILFYDDLVLDSEELIIPHPLIAQRKFILEPLYEIAPEYFHPVLKEKIIQIRLNCMDTSKVSRIESSGQ